MLQESLEIRLFEHVGVPNKMKQPNEHFLVYRRKVQVYILGKNILFLALGVMTSHDSFPQTPLLILALDLSFSVPFMLIILPPRWLWLAVLTRKGPMLLEHVGQH